MSSPTNFEAIESASNHAAHQAKGTDEADAQYLMASPRTKNVSVTLLLLCWFLDAGNNETFRTLRGPASKKRQGRRVLLMFATRVISNSCAWQKQHIRQPLRD